MPDEHAVDLAFKASPGAHDQAACDSSQRSGCLDRTEDEAVAVGPGQDHRRKNGPADACEQVTEKENQLKAQQAWALKDVFEPVGRFLPDLALLFLAFRRLDRLRNKDEQQRSDGD